MSHRTHRITAESILNMRFSERLALEMITASLWPLAADERIGLLLTMLADNLCDVAETDEEIDAIVERLCLRIQARMSQPHIHRLRCAMYFIRECGRRCGAALTSRSSIRRTRRYRAAPPRHRLRTTNFSCVTRRLHDPRIARAAVVAVADEQPDAFVLMLAAVQPVVGAAVNAEPSSSATLSKARYGPDLFRHAL